MSIRQINITKETPPSDLYIGRVAENEVTGVEFDLTPWIQTYGAGTATIVMKRWGDTDPYPIALEIDENGKATWMISEADVAKPGYAYAQLSFETATEKRKKSPIYTLKIGKSLIATGEQPDPYDSWLEALLHIAAKAMAEALDIEGIATDDTLSIEGGIADAKAAGDALALKADKLTTYTKTEVDQMIEDVEIETDTTLAIAGAPADAAETGRQFGLLKADLNENVNTFGSELFSETPTELRKTNDGYRLNAAGYRITDANYKLNRYRVFAGDTVKVVSDDRWQFQNTVDVTTSGTQYIIGEKHGAGTVYTVVPEAAQYVVLSTPITGSGASVNKLTSNVDALNAGLNTVKADIANSRNNFSALINVYTSQVSDVKYPGTPSEVTVGIDTSVPKFTAGTQHAVCIPIISGTTIRLTKPQTNYCLVCFTAEYPAANVSITHYTSKTGVENTNIVAESQENDNYLVIYTHTVTLDPSDCDISYSQVARGTVELLPQLDEHMVNLLKYRPVGKISKPYIALSCDDGTAALATYTLPRIQYWNNQYNTNIPLHMALFDNCDVFANETYKALVVDMCENHNCSIGIHGDRPFGDYSSSTALYAYMKKQRDSIISNTGVTPTSVMYPHSSYNDKIMVMAGAFCGACGVANGSIDTPYTYKDDLGFQFYVGEKSNCYALYRLNIKDTRIGDVTGVHKIIDYAKAHDLIICPYFHDNDFTTHDDATNTFYRNMLDAFIQYGMEQGVEFINFGDIPTLL